MGMVDLPTNFNRTITREDIENGNQTPCPVTYFDVSPFKEDAPVNRPPVRQKYPTDSKGKCSVVRKLDF